MLTFLYKLNFYAKEVFDFLACFFYTVVFFIRLFDYSFGVLYQKVKVMKVCISKLKSLIVNALKLSQY